MTTFLGIVAWVILHFSLFPVALSGYHSYNGAHSLGEFIVYTYVSSIARYKKSSQAWVEVDVRNMKVNEIIKRFSNVYFTFTHDVLPGNRYCFLNDFLSVTIDRELTLNAALNFLGDRVFPTTPDALTLISKSASYADALQANWQFKTFPSGSHPDTPALDSMKTDMFLTKSGVDMVEAGNSLVCFVNGMAHLTYHGYDGIVAKGAGRTIRNTDSALVNLLNLGLIGETQCVDITSAMLHPGVNNAFDETMDGYIGLNQDLTNKTVILSIGGILFFEGAVNQVINRAQGAIKLNYGKIDHPTFLYDISRFIRPDNLGTLMDLINANMLLKSHIYDVDNLKAIVDMPQTFAIIVDAPNVLYSYSPVRDLTFKNSLVSYQHLQRPIRSYSGRMLPYRILTDGDRYVYHVDHYRKPNFTNWGVTGFAFQDQITVGTFMETNAMDQSNVFMDIKTQWFE